MDKFGTGEQISRDRLGDCSKPLDFSNFTFSMFRQMCILSGCDYLSSVPGLGLKKAYNLIKIYGNASKVISYLRNKGSNVPDQYEEKFEQAELTFLHQRVWDPVKLQLVHLYPLPDVYSTLEDDQLRFLGPSLSREMAQQIATAIIDPESKKRYPEPVTVNSLSKSTSMISSYRTPQNHKIESFFSPVSKSTQKPKLEAKAPVHFSPFFKAKPSTPINKSKFLINRSSSSPSLKPIVSFKNQIVRPIPFKVEEPEEKEEGEGEESKFFFFHNFYYYQQLIFL